MQNRVTKKLFTGLVFFYPLVVYLAVKSYGIQVASLVLSLILLGRILFSSQTQNRFSRTIDPLLWIVVGYNLLNLYFQNEWALKIYPVLMSLAFFFVFARSLWQGSPIIEDFARQFEKNLTPEKKTYIRRLTWVWAGWLLLNSLISLATGFVSMEVWALYNNLISYLLSGCLIAVDVGYRTLKVRTGKAYLSQKSLAAQLSFDHAGASVSSQDFLRHVGSAIRFLEGKGERVTLWFEDSYLFAVGLFASLAAGKKIIILPNNKSETRNRFRQEFDFVVEDSVIQNIEAKDFLPKIAVSKKAEVAFFTSGSSGAPEKVVKTFDHLYTEVLSLEKTFADKVSETCFASSVSHHHVYGFLFSVLWPVLTGRSFCRKLIEYPEQLQNQSKFPARISFVSSPAFLKRFYLPNQKIENSNVVFSSGGPLEYSVVQMVEDYFGKPPVEVYGSTESGGIAYRQRTSSDQPWQPFAVVQVSEGPNAQLEVRSPYFSQSRLVMADRIEMKGNGFSLLGRTDDVVKIEEKRISLIELNQRILATSLVQDSTVVATEINGRQQTACLAVLSEAGSRLVQADDMTVVSEEIRRALKDDFDAIVIPRKFRFVGSLPYNSQSKLIKNEVLRYFHEDR